MKIQIDTTLKTIKLETSENLGEFFKALELMLPNDLWKEFKLETNTIINWNTPIIWQTDRMKGRTQSWKCLRCFCHPPAWRRKRRSRSASDSGRRALTGWNWTNPIWDGSRW